MASMSRRWLITGLDFMSDLKKWTRLCPAHLVVVGLINLTSVSGTFSTQVFTDFQNPKVTRQTATRLALWAELGLELLIS